MREQTVTTSTLSSEVSILSKVQSYDNRTYFTDVVKYYYPALADVRYEFTNTPYEKGVYLTRHGIPLHVNNNKLLGPPWPEPGGLDRGQWSKLNTEPRPRT